MRLIRELFAISCAVAVAFQSVLCSAQAQGQAPGSYPARVVPQAAEIDSPFTVNAPASLTANAIGFLSQDTMSPQDQQAARDALPEIQSKAMLAGFDYPQGKWSYQQIVCPVIPEHLLLLYSRNEGAEDFSMFSAILPRDGKGSARVLPILRRSFSLYTPAPVNPLMIAEFNRVRLSDRSVQKPDWLVTGLCYAALAGAHVVLTPTHQSGKESMPALTPLLHIDNGMSIVTFVDTEMPQEPKLWELTFDPTGKLVKVEVSKFSALQPKLLP